jgi:hypothetical protein
MVLLHTVLKGKRLILRKGPYCREEGAEGKRRLSSGSHAALKHRPHEEDGQRKCSAKHGSTGL